MNIRREMAQEILDIIAKEQSPENILAEITAFCQNENRMRSVYFVDVFNKDSEGFIPCIAVEGEKGYYRTDWHWDCTLEEAEGLCKKMNSELGFDDPKEIYKIISSTMSFGKG